MSSGDKWRLTPESEFLANVLKQMERETGIEPATSSLGKYKSIVNQELRRLWALSGDSERLRFQWRAVAPPLTEPFWSQAARMRTVDQTIRLLRILFQGWQ
jgi:hypothetical protein